MRTININHIHQMSNKRPPGYVEEVLACGKVENGILHITKPRRLAKLRKKYADMEQFQGRSITPEEAKRINRGNIMEVAGPPLWADLHATAAAGKLTPEWLAEFALRIPCGMCRPHWRELLKTHPPRYDDQYQWSVEVHNVVNVRLGKPVWTIDTDQ